MVQVKVKRFSRGKTEIQPEIQPEVLPVNEENEEIKENEEYVTEVPIFNELDDLTNINFNKKKNIEAEEILKKVIDKKKEAPIESNPGEGLLTKIINRRKEQSQKVQTHINSSNDDDDATPILGKDRRILTSKIQQYKTCFLKY
jgi:hypothetical protein